MNRRRLGRTEHRSSLAVLGGIAFHFTDEAGAVELVQQVVDAGVNHLDIAPGYLTAEEKAGRALRETGWRPFMACKTAAATRDDLRRELERSLELLGVDRFDLYQLHGVVRLADLDARAEAAEALLGARDEGLCAFVGITGHGETTPEAQAEAVRRYDLDTVMFPVNAALWGDDAYRAAAEALLATAAERDLGVMAIKAAAWRPWDAPPEERHATTWYEPYTDPDEIARNVDFTLSTPGVHAFCTPGDVSLLGPALAAATRFTGMDDDARARATEAVRGSPSIFVGL